jgi:cholesterol transport system auxiliary component
MIRLGAVLLLITTAGCSVFRSSAPAEQVYYLRAHTQASAPGARPAPAPALRVARPVAGPGLDTPRIVLVESDRRMSYYTASRWPAPLPEVLEALAVESLNASGSWGSVQSSESPFPFDYVLQIRIRRFEADYTGGSSAPVAHVALDCIVGRREGREIIATFVAEGSTPAAANRLHEVVAAFEDATNTALESLTTRASAAVHDAAQKVESPEPSISR